MALSPFVSQNLGTFVATQAASDLTVLTELVEAGTVTPVIDRTYPLGALTVAIRYLRQGHAKGEVVIRV
jgi:NADPH:quinone reductase-like Zn-dependent oxidoreductase